MSLVSGTTYITEEKELTPVTFLHPNVLCIHFQSGSKQHAGRERSNNVLKSQGKEIYFFFQTLWIKLESNLALQVAGSACTPQRELTRTW